MSDTLDFIFPITFADKILPARSTYFHSGCLESFDFCHVWNSKMIIIDQLFRLDHPISAFYPWILFLIDQVYHISYSVIMAFSFLILTFIDQLYRFGHYSVTELSSWLQIIIGIIAGFLIANLILSISSAISFQLAKKYFHGQLVTSEYVSIDTFIESIERCPRPSKPKPKPPIPKLDVWAQEVQQQAENDSNDINNETDEDPGETSLFTEDYISESEHNKALASLNQQIGGLIKRISKRDQLLQKSRGETMNAETVIDELRDKVKCLETETAQNKNIIEDLQISHNEKEKLIHRLRKQLFRPTHELLLRENYSFH